MSDTAPQNPAENPNMPQIPVATYELFIRAPGEDGRQPKGGCQHATALRAALVMLSQLADNPTIREIRIAKKEGTIIQPFRI